ncbi:unnamed protein product [Adineta ricciae]|uniref:Uncharacterized protein n=1 Tax=Adineta ricciae TaxID=249248 RepID=A0A816BCM2_ADIRI|nr:unnamed protein product [Adineta ricciae]
MNDTRPLLLASNNDGSDKKSRTLFRIFRHWRQFFGVSQANDEYQNLNDTDDEHIENEPSINIFELFRFADRMDLFLILIGLCGNVVEALTWISSFVLLGRLAGTLSAESSNGSSVFQYGNPVDATKINDGCPPAIELNSFNFIRLQNFCNGSDDVTSSLSLDPSNSSIRNFRFQSTTVRYQICLLADSPTARTHTHTPYNHQQHKVRFSKCHVMDMFPGRSFRRLGPLKSESVPVQLFSIPAQLSPIPASSLPLDSGRNPAARKWSENEPNRPEQTVPQQPGFARRVQYR